MLKLMKYEFRKMRMPLVVMLLALAALEAAFLIGYSAHKPEVYGTALALITGLVFAAYGYILVAGIVSYSRELTNRTGYLVFMTPTRPIGIVLSKLVSTIVAAIAATAVFGLAAYLDYTFLFGRLDIDPETLQQVRMQLDLMLKAGFADITMNADRLTLVVLYTAASVLIEVMFTMCTAYLAITFSATFLQNKKGVVRGLVSVALFFVIVWISSWTIGKIIDVMPDPTTLALMFRLLAVNLAFNLALSALFACLSAWLLKTKVSL